MQHTVTWFDRLRIERVVWSLDQRLYDLPRRSRIDKRREVRENLRAAATDIGARKALARLGNSRELASEYLTAEFGGGPRPSWIAAALFLFTGVLVGTSLLTDAAIAYRDGILAADPHATGTFTWSGIDYLQTSVQYTFVDGSSHFAGGAFTPLAWLLWVIATVLVGRLWRLPSVWRRRRAATRTASER
jgi:hypothetical protein